MSKNYNDEELYALGRRAVACKGWRWLGGMKALNSFRVVESVVPMMFPVDTPDLSDPATLGCLLALVREAWKEPRAWCEWDRTIARWGVYSGSGVNARSICATEAEALVHALEIAP